MPLSRLLCFNKGHEVDTFTRRPVSDCPLEGEPLRTIIVNNLEATQSRQQNKQPALELMHLIDDAVGNAETMEIEITQDFMKLFKGYDFYGWPPPPELVNEYPPPIFDEIA